MKIYLTTDAAPEGNEYTCYIWLSEPEPDGEYEEWWHQDMECLHVGFFRKNKLAALGYVWTATESEVTGPRPDPKDRIVYWEQFQESQKLMREGEFEAAVEAIRELLSEDPDNVVAMGSLANALARTGHDDERRQPLRERPLRHRLRRSRGPTDGAADPRVRRLAA